MISSEKQGAKLEVKAGAKVSDKDIRIGGVASDATNNVNIYTDLALRLVSAEGEITNAETGKTYTMGEVKAAQRTFSDIKKLTTEGASKETHDVAIKYCKDQGEVAALVAEKKDSEASGGGSLAYFKKQDTTAPTETQTVSGGWNS